MIEMLAAPIFFLLLIGAFAFMMLNRRRVLSDSAVSIQNIESFDDPVAAVIKEAGSDERHVRQMSCCLQLADLRKIGRDSRVLMQTAGELREKTWAQVAQGIAGLAAPEADDVDYVTELHQGLLRVNSSLIKKMFLSAIEIICGKVVHHTHYHYTYAVAAEYCAEVYIVESMADIIDEPTALLLRTHLS